MKICENFKRFQYFNYETNFLENGNLFQKTGAPFFSLSTKIEKASFPYKTAMSEVNVKTNRMVTTKWTYHKERSLPVITLFSWRFCVSLRTSYKELICCTNNPNAHICTFCKRWSFIWRSFFPVGILKDIMMENFVALLKNVTLLLRTVKALI